jgi:predicted MFS family arabinose efflux permease
MISISGLFAVTFSVVFAYVADVTEENQRSTAYGLVSATFAASLITSPAIGSYLSRFYSENFVIALATAVSIFDLFFILVAVPESLPDKLRERSKSISWDQVDPFKSLKNVFSDRTLALLCLTVFLSYLPEAGQYSCFFVFLKLVIGFSQQSIAYFIAYIGIMSCLAQSAVLALIIKFFGKKESIIIGLVFQVLQLAIYGFAVETWLIWFAGLLAAISSITYPAISAFISNNVSADSQGIAQGTVTGIRGLCNGIGPAFYGLLFWAFNVNLNDPNGHSANNNNNNNNSNNTNNSTHDIHNVSLK